MKVLLWTLFAAAGIFLFMLWHAHTIFGEDD